MDENQCLLCSASERVTSRPILLWRDDGTERVDRVGLCAQCRDRLTRLDEARQLALAETPKRQRRLRVWDLVGVYLVLAGAFGIGAATDLMPSWGWWVAAAMLVLTVPAALGLRAYQEKVEKERDERWARSQDGRELAEVEETLRSQWRAHADRLREGSGYASVRARDGEKWYALDEEALAAPATWHPGEAGEVRWVVRQDDGAMEVRRRPVTSA